MTEKNTDFNCASVKKRLKKLEVDRTINLACITTRTPYRQLGYSTPRAAYARMLIMAYLLGKKYSINEVSAASQIPLKDLDRYMEKYTLLNSRGCEFTVLESNFLKLMQICSKPKNQKVSM